jgi:chaperonin GroES
MDSDVDEGFYPEDQDLQEPQERAFNVLDTIGRQNITDLLDDAKLQEIGSRCVREYEIDDANFSDRKRKIEDLYKLALQAAEVKNYPFPNASNIKYPLLTKAALGFASLAYPSIVKDDRVVKCRPVGNDEGKEIVRGPDGNPMIDPETGKEVKKNAGAKAMTGERVSQFMSHQVLEEMDGWEDDMDKILHIIPIIGCAFKKTYFDPLEGKNVSRLVLPQFFVMNIDARTVETASRGSELVQFYPNEIRENINAGVFREFDYQSSTETLNDQYKGRDSKSSGAHDEDKPHLFIEQHRRLDLDGDGYAEPYIVWVHKETSQVARMLPRFAQEDILADGMKIVRIRPESYYTKFGFIPDPEGSPYDIGFGHLLQHINEAANTSINQLIDSGHRYVMGGGFIGDGMRIKGGNLRFKPGEFKRVKTSGMSVRENVVPLPMPEPSTVLMALMEFLIRAAEDMASMTKVLAGDIPANMPATTALASIEQGLQPFKAVFKRIHRALKKEFKRLYYLNQQYLGQEEYQRVLDDPAANIERDFLSKSVDVLPVSDPEMISTTQALVRAQALLELKDDPLMDGVEIRRRALRAMNIHDADALVKIPPQSVDELAEAQKAALDAQITSLERDADRKDMEVQIKLNKSEAEIQKIMADAAYALAKAESEDKGNQIEIFKTQLQQLAHLRKRTNGPGRVGPLEKQPGN